MEIRGIFSGWLETINGEFVRVISRDMWSSYMDDPEIGLWGKGRKNFLSDIDELWSLDKSQIAAWKFIDLPIVDAETRAKASIKGAKDGTRTMRVPLEQPSRLGQFNSTLPTLLSKGYVASSAGKTLELGRQKEKRELNQPQKEHRVKTQFPEAESFETINNVLRTIKEYRDYTSPDSLSWNEYVQEFFHVLGFELEELIISPESKSSIKLLKNIGANSIPIAAMIYHSPKLSLQPSINDIFSDFMIRAVANKIPVNWGIMTDGMQLKIIDCKKNNERPNYWPDLDGIIVNERTDSFFSLYKVISLIKDGKVVDRISEITHKPVEHREQKRQRIQRTERIQKVQNHGIYDVEYHTYNKPQYTQDFFEALRSKILLLPDSPIERSTKVYIGYSRNRNFCEIEFFRDKLKVFVDLAIEKIHDPLGLCQDVRGIGHHGSGETRVVLNRIEDVEAVFAIIKQAYDVAE